MYRMEFEPPVDYYDEKIEDIDEEICQLVKKRKDRSTNNPGFPTKTHISVWAKKYGFYEDFLNGIFTNFLFEESFKPVVEPKGFVKNIPVLKSFEANNVFYSITFIRQYDNASVVHMTIDREISYETFDPHSYKKITHFKLFINGGGANYHCYDQDGGGSNGHMSYSYIVTPPLPLEEPELTLVFKESKDPFKIKFTGFEFSITLID